jgi:hypothetical protein
MLDPTDGSARSDRNAAPPDFDTTLVRIEGAVRGIALGVLEPITVIEEDGAVPVFTDGTLEAPAPINSVID